MQIGTRLLVVMGDAYEPMYTIVHLATEGNVKVWFMLLVVCVCVCVLNMRQTCKPYHL